MLNSARQPLYNTLSFAIPRNCIFHFFTRELPKLKSDSTRLHWLRQKETTVLTQSYSHLPFAPAQS
jgi:hypothetical protein